MAMIQVDEAREIILSKIDFKGVEKVSLDNALGRILAEDIVAQRSNPPMDNSAMDGYAVITADILSATPDNPVKLEVVEHVPAGAVATVTLKNNQAIRIMTGAPIPPGADAVLMQEDTDKNGNGILAKDKTEVGENIRLAGEDVKVGDLVIKKGVTITPSHIGMMAVVGRSNIYVSQRPTVAILSTGDEIIELDGQPDGTLHLQQQRLYAGRADSIRWRHPLLSWSCQRQRRRFDGEIRLGVEMRYRCFFRRCVGGRLRSRQGHARQNGERNGVLESGDETGQTPRFRQDRRDTGFRPAGQSRFILCFL